MSPDLLLPNDAKTKADKRNVNSKVVNRTFLKDESVLFSRFEHVRPSTQGSSKYISYRNPAWSRFVTNLVFSVAPYIYEM